MTLPTFLRGLAAPVLTCGADVALAHPGHGLNDASSLLHLLEAEHVLPLLALLAIGYAFVGLRALRRRRADRDQRGHDQQR